MTTALTTTRIVNIQAAISERDLSDVLITACEGGIGYWFRGLEYVHTAPEGAWISGYVTDEVAECDNLDADGYGYNATDDHAEDALCDECVEATTLIDLDVIVAGVERILNGSVGIRADLVAQVMTLTTGEPDVDSDAADCIVQAGLFGEVVYG